LKPPSNLIGGTMHLPPASHQIDHRLVLGGIAFGTGWGMVGFCPGPALVALGAGELKAAVFVAAMVFGMILFEVAETFGSKPR